MNEENNQSPFPTLNQINNNVEEPNNESSFAGYANNNQTNPGFVDVNQIMNNAQDINTTQNNNSSQQFMPDVQTVEQNNTLMEEKEDSANEPAVDVPASDNQTTNDNN